MSTTNHTPVATGAAVNASVVNSPLGSLDAAIGDLTTLTTTAKGSVVTAMNEMDSVKLDAPGSTTANYVLAAPDGTPGTPSMRALVNADLPLSGVSAGSYPKVTVNTRGIVTGASSSITTSEISDIASYKIDDLAAGDDNTDLDSSTSRHGLLKKLANDARQYLDGVGAWVKWASGIKLNGSGAYTARGYIDFRGAGVTVQDDSANDSIRVTITGTGGSFTLDDMTDVTIATPLDNQAVVYDAASGSWQNKNISSIVPTGHVIDDEGVVLTNRPTLNFIGSGVTAEDNAGTNRTDVTITSLANDPLWAAAGDVAVATGNDAAAVVNLTEQTVLGRITGGSVKALSVAELITLVLSAALPENVEIQLDAALSADEKYSGIVEAGTAGATLAFGDLCYLAVADSRWELTDADAQATAFGKLGICVLAAAGDGSATKMLLYGKVRADTAFPTLTVGAPVFVSTDAGDITNTAPSGAADIMRVIGYGNTGDELHFCPSPDYFEHA